MVSKFLKIAALSLAATVALGASTAQAQVAGVKTIYITNANGDYIQIGDVSSLEDVTFKNVAHSVNGATATALTEYSTTQSPAVNAIDETYSGDYYGTPGIYHSGYGVGNYLQIDLALVSTLRNLSITGRSDNGFGVRDIFNYSLIAADGTTVLKSGTLDNRALNGAANLVSFVPEPATWAMMIMGFGVVGGVMRRRKAVATPAFA